MSHETPISDGALDTESNPRREFLTKAAIAAAVTTAAGLGMSRSAQALNGDIINVGAAESGNVTTSLSGGSTFKVIDGGSAGTGGTNARLGSILGTQSANSRSAVMGEATGTSGCWAVYGHNTSSSGIGVYGLNEGSGGVGVYGEHIAASTESGTGVVGVSNSGTGVEGRGAAFDLHAGSSGRVLLNTAGAASPPSGGSLGTIARDTAGNMWVCVAVNSWRKIAGPTSAGAFHALVPGRVYDSRVASPSTGQLATGANRLISVADRRDLDSGAVVQANFVPAGATAVTANVTVTGTVLAGFIAVNPGGTLAVTASTSNWGSSGQTLANGVSLTLNASRQLSLIVGGLPGAATDIVVDVTGFYL